MNRQKLQRLNEALSFSQKGGYLGEDVWRKDINHIIEYIQNDQRVMSLSDEGFDTFVNRLRVKWQNSQYEPGTFIGVRVAQDIVQPLTQEKLKSFYKVGQDRDNSDINAYKRLISNSHNRKDITLDVYFKHIKGYAQVLSREGIFVHRVVKDFIASKEVILNERDNEALVGRKLLDEHVPALLLHLDKSLMASSRVTIPDLVKAMGISDTEVVFYRNRPNTIIWVNAFSSSDFTRLTKSAITSYESKISINRFKEEYCVDVQSVNLSLKEYESDEEIRNVLASTMTVQNSELWTLRVSFVKSEFVARYKRYNPGIDADDETIIDAQMQELTNVITSTDGSYEYQRLHDDGTTRVYIIMPFSNISTLKDAVAEHKVTSDISWRRVSGIPGISQSDVSTFVDDTGKESGIRIRGTPLKSLLSFPGIDIRRTRTNSVGDAFDALGLEAAVHVFVDQMLKCVSADKSSGSNICNNVELVANSVSITGEMVGITKSGMEKADGSFLTLLTFENAIGSMSKTAFGCEDDVTEVAPCVLVGKRIDNTLRFS
ncbi:hypothetical protein HDU85_005906 [Gaertneriomyces sp. JEL0708]|nr:hypothetical protein HDU85_005906 [Gaertneriomyces sp. JEL0708]